MKKAIKMSIWSTGILIGIIVIAVVISLIGFIKAAKGMTPSETGPVNDSVWCIKDRFVNAYLFRGKQRYILFDAGLSSKNFAKELAKTGISPDQINTLFLTHTDGDHIGATGLFKNAVIYLHRDEEQMINGATGKTIFSKRIWKYGPYKLLSDNDSLIIDGLRIKILHIPGHTPGSSCYIVSNDYLVTGDNVTIKNGDYFHISEKFNMDTPKQVESLKLLPPVESFKYILAGHDGIFKVSDLIK